MDRKSISRRVVAGLRKAYPDARTELKFGNPLELLIATVLSAQCTDKRVNDVTSRLFRKYRTAKDYAQASRTVLESEIRSTGFFRQKARSIGGIARVLVDKHGSKVPKTMDELIRLPGVARKTANVVLGSAYGVSGGVVVDTHVRRLAFRMGLSDEKEPEKIEKDLMELVSCGDWIWFSHAMIWHGRRVCSARSPQCANCVVKGSCPKREL